METTQTVSSLTFIQYDCPARRTSASGATLRKYGGLDESKASTCSTGTDAFRSATVYVELKDGKDTRFHPSCKCIVV